MSSKEPGEHAIDTLRDMLDDGGVVIRYNLGHRIEEPYVDTSAPVTTTRTREKSRNIVVMTIELLCPDTPTLRRSP